MLALIETLQSELPRAIGRLGTATRLAPRNATAWLALAHLHKQNDDPAAALSAANRILPLCDSRDDRVAVLVLKGDILAALGRDDEARACFEQVLHLAPSSGDAHRGLAQRHAAQDRWDETRKHAQSAIRLEASDGATRRTLGDAFYSSNDLGPALWQYTLSLASSAEGYRRTAEALAHQDFAEGALAILRIAMVFHPSDVTLFLDTARVYCALNRRAEALALCEAALRLKPGHAAARQLQEELQAKESNS